MKSSNYIVSENLAYLICNKDVVYDCGNFYQSETTIYSNHWIETIHEVAHWFACEPIYRNHYNLSLPCIEDDSNIRMLSEEAHALIITKMLFEKYAHLPTSDEVLYIEYLVNQSYEILSKVNFDYDILYHNSNKLFEQYTNEISKELLYCNLLEKNVVI